mmetsp:Transcript_26158/g.26590  ORF Transcript_26158/g.26590 Transcript_26158/m.26590 type:complete len:393 (-) Transcript_26158:251-1429(-)
MHATKAASIISRRWRDTNNNAIVRMGGVIRQKLFTGNATLGGEILSSENLATNSAATTLDRLFLTDTNNYFRVKNDNRRGFSSNTTNEDAPSSSSSSSNSGGTYAVVDHSEAYEMAMEGRHGQKLALARLEGIGKDDLPFDPFLEEEEQILEEERQQQLLEAGEGEIDNDENDDSMEDEYDDFLDDIEEDNEEENCVYNRDGTLRRKKSTLATLRAGYPAGGLFAVLEIAGSQHKVTTDDLLVVNRLKPVDHYKIGSVHTFKDNDILLIGSTHLTMVGMPYVNGAEVDVMVEEITQDAKVIIFKKRRRKHSQRKNGFRRDLTLLRVLDIRLPEEYKDHQYVGRDSVDELENEELDRPYNKMSSTSTSSANKKFDIAKESYSGKGEQLKSAQQ